MFAGVNASFAPTGATTNPARGANRALRDLNHRLAVGLNLKIAVEVNAGASWRAEAFLAPFAPVSSLAAA